MSTKLPNLSGNPTREAERARELTPREGSQAGTIKPFNFSEVEYRASQHTQGKADPTVTRALKVLEDNVFSLRGHLNRLEIPGGTGDSGQGLDVAETYEVTQTFPPPSPTASVPISYFWGYYIYNPPINLASNTPADIADRVNCYEFFLPFSVTISKITTEITTARAGTSRYSVGLYIGGVNGTLGPDTGPLVATPLGVVQTTIPTITLEPGLYCMAQTGNDQLIQTAVMFAPTDVAGNHNYAIYNKSYQRFGFAANNSTGGQLPATTGGLSPFANNRPIVAALFE